MREEEKKKEAAIAEAKRQEELKKLNEAQLKSQAEQEAELQAEKNEKIATAKKAAKKKNEARVRQEWDEMRAERGKYSNSVERDTARKRFKFSNPNSQHTETK